MALPIWFRLSIAVLFGSLFAVYLVVRESVGQEAAARILPDDSELVPLWGSEALRSTEEPPNGSYRVNGMRVEYRTYDMVESPAETLRKFERSFAAAGYRVRRLSFLDRPTLVAIHPATAMMLTVRAAAEGRPSFRLTQQNLSEFDPRAAAASGLPIPPGARQALWIVPASSGGDKSGSSSVGDRRWAESDDAGGTLAYIVDRPFDWTARSLDAELSASGWNRSVPGASLERAGVSTLFFTKGSQSASVVLMQLPSRSATLVLVNR